MRVAHLPLCYSELRFVPMLLVFQLCDNCNIYSGVSLAACALQHRLAKQLYPRNSYIQISLFVSDCTDGYHASFPYVLISFARKTHLHVQTQN